MGDSNELAPNRKRSRDGPFKCKNCDREFPSAQALGGHRSGYSKPLLQWMPPGVAPFTCHECDQKFLTRRSLTRHRRHHVIVEKEAAGSSSSGTKESGEHPKIKRGGKKTVMNPAAKTSDIDGVKMTATVENNPRLKNIDLNLTPFINFVEHGVLFS